MKQCEVCGFWHECECPVTRYEQEYTAQPGVVYPSARKCLEAHIGCRQVRSPERKGWRNAGWSIYWSEGGAELTLYPGGEGPQEARDIDEMMEWIGGDQAVELNPGTIKYINSLPVDERAKILEAIR